MFNELEAFKISIQITIMMICQYKFWNITIRASLSLTYCVQLFDNHCISDCVSLFSGQGVSMLKM